MGETITLPAYAKINLFLDITGVLPNGYHTLNNIMQQIGLYDNVTVAFEKRSESSVEIMCDNPLIPCDERNIAYKAAKLFLAECGGSGKVIIDIKKNIPVMAGLGGSSTDGAAVLVALNELCGKPFSKAELEKMGAVLGADVSFCIRGGCAYCKGIGEVMTDIAGLPLCSVLIIKPDFSCNTAEAYGQYDKNPIKSVSEPEKLLRALKKGELSEISNSFYNVFELLNNVQETKAIKEALINSGAMGASLTGSGSAVYGIFPNEDTAFNAARNLNYRVRIVASPLTRLHTEYGASNFKIL